MSQMTAWTVEAVHCAIQPTRPCTCSACASSFGLRADQARSLEGAPGTPQRGLPCHKRTQETAAMIKVATITEG
jgi:hypothetical protein